MGVRKTHAEVVRDFNRVHKGLYDYSKVVYKNTHTPVTVICKDHGEFYPRPDNHISRKSGCPACAREVTAAQNKARRTTTAQFITHSIVAHGDKYDYSKSICTGTHKPVIIGCKIHGDFTMLAGNHFGKQRQGCPTCGMLGRHDAQRYSEEEWIAKARRVHGDKYDYSNVGYRGTKFKVLIRCKKHGDFTQLPSEHMVGKGCAACANRKPLTTDVYIKRAQQVHGDKYDYSETKYRGHKTKVSIHCRIHGNFMQLPFGHTFHKQGCPSCAPQYSKADIVYVHKADRIRYNGKQVYKIGVTSTTATTNRHKVLERALGSPLIKVAQILCKEGKAFYHEAHLLGFGEDPKFIPFDGSNEYRAISKNDMHKISQYVNHFTLRSHS